MRGAMVVNVVALQAAQADVRNAARSMDVQLGDLAKYLQPLMQEWGGEAQQLYLAKHDQWVRAAAELHLILSEVERALAESAADYAETERRNASYFR